MADPESDKVGLLLLAGGEGRRFAERGVAEGEEPLPKQFHLLQGMALACHSFQSFCAFPAVGAIVVVALPTFWKLFQLPPERSASLQLFFAEPGRRRQDSVLQGLTQLLKRELPFSLTLVHDAARPLVPLALLPELIAAAAQCGAAAVAAPVTDTIKVCDGEGRIIQTPPRERVWAVQTPQCLQSSLLLQGLHHAEKAGITVTDDLSAVELLGLRPKLLLNQEQNIKVTRPEDLRRVEELLATR